MSFGFDDPSKIPGQQKSASKRRQVPKRTQNGKVASTMQVIETATKLVEKGFLNDRLFKSEAPQASESVSTTKYRRMGRPRKILDKDTITMTGEREIIEEFRSFCTKMEGMSFVECLGELVDRYKKP